MIKLGVIEQLFRLAMHHLKITLIKELLKAI
jgi:hypothetical protein